MNQMQKNIDSLLKNKIAYLSDESSESEGIAISTRIRLARNIKDLAFPTAATVDELKRSVDACRTAFDNISELKRTLKFDFAKLEDIDKQILRERHLISTEFATREDNALLAVCKDESCAIMVNEEDHLRLQILQSGLNLEQTWKKIDALDNKLNANLPYVFDERLGFLTACPTNVGTGMRASVMLHLPCLVLSNQIAAVVQGVSKLGLSVRGIFGEGSDNRGNFFQVSNQSTLGESEEQIITRLNKVIRRIIVQEKLARSKMLENSENFIFDYVGRGYGLLRHAYLLSSEEALNSLSALRLGIDIGMFSLLRRNALNELFILIHPAHLQHLAGKILSHEERDSYRAELVRNKLKGLEQKQ